MVVCFDIKKKKKGGGGGSLSIKKERKRIITLFLQIFVYKDSACLKESLEEMEYTSKNASASRIPIIQKRVVGR